MRRAVRAGLFVAALLGGGCATTALTQLDPAWDPRQRQPYEAVLVVAAGDAAFREAVEPALARHVRRAGAVARPSLELVDGDLSAEAVEALVRASGFDAVLVTRVVEVDRARRYDEGATFTSLVVDPAFESTHGGAAPLYARGAVFPYVQESVTLGAGWEEHTLVVLETTLFRVSDGASTWHARTRAVDPGGLGRASRSYARLVVDGLRRVGQLPLAPDWP